LGQAEVQFFQQTLSGFLLAICDFNQTVDLFFWRYQDDPDQCF
jgi:hypothetical protein